MAAAGSRGSAALAALLAVVVGGCDPTIEAWRSLSGISANDPNPKTAPFTENLAEAAAKPYPNLATVPPPPTRETTAAERQKLTQSLLADRSATAALTPAPISGGAPAEPQSPHIRRPADAQPLGRRDVAAAPMPDAAPAGAANAHRTETVAAGAAPRTAAAAASPPAIAAKTAGTKANALAKNGTGPRPAGEPPQPQPLNSDLQTPRIASLPQPEAPRPAPPPPVLAPVPQPMRTAEPAPAAVATAMPAPAPPPPVLAAIAPPPRPAKTEPSAPAAVTVATLAGGAASVGPPASEAAEIAHVAELYKQAPRNVRVVAYAAAPAGGADPLAAYRAALDRAQSVAKALVQAGIPAARVQTRATPAAAGGAGRVEIQFAP